MTTAEATLTVQEAAEVLGVHRDTLVRASDQGRIPCVRTPGGHRRFRRSDLEEFLAGEADGDGREATA